MSRVVCVWGPDFDEPGKEGIEAAADVARQIEQVVRDIPNQMEKQGADPNLVKAARDYFPHFRYAVRKIDL